MEKAEFDKKFSGFVQNSVHNYRAFIIKGNTDNGDTDDHSKNRSYRSLYEILKPKGNEFYGNYDDFRSELSKYLVINKKSKMNAQKLAVDKKKYVICQQTKNVYEPNGLVICDGDLTGASPFDVELGKRLPSIIETINSLCEDIVLMHKCRANLEKMRDERQMIYEEMTDEEDIYRAR